MSFPVAPFPYRYAFFPSIGKFPTSDGQVAPGMNCQYSVKFAPDSLADYDDFIKVFTMYALFFFWNMVRPRFVYVCMYVSFCHNENVFKLS